MKRLKINKEKSIGQVIYIVEGDKTEHELIERIYVQLGYSVVTYNKLSRSCTCLQGHNKYSRVFIIPAFHPAIVSLDTDKDYFDEVYRLLALGYGLDVENSAIFYLFDRDRLSNRPSQIIPQLEKFGSSRSSSGFDMNGLFLLSYPSIEAYIITAYGDEIELSTAKEAKKYVESHKYLAERLDSVNMLTAALSMISVLELVLGVPFTPQLLDDFSDTNKILLSYQDKKWAEEHKYNVLSLLSASLIDLGIISYM